jgi:hypothetical protein
VLEEAGVRSSGEGKERRAECLPVIPDCMMSEEGRCEPSLPRSGSEGEKEKVTRGFSPEYGEA